jgi:hypothetical protein
MLAVVLLVAWCEGELMQRRAVLGGSRTVLGGRGAANLAQLGFQAWLSLQCACTQATALRVFSAELAEPYSFVLPLKALSSQVGSVHALWPTTVGTTSDNSFAFY